MISGGACSYEDGSQLAQATEYLRAHRRNISLVTIDIGANDIDGCVVGGIVDQVCVQNAFHAVATNLPLILSALRQAVGPDVPIIGMNYYDPFLAAWLQGASGQALAQASEQLLLQYNAVIDQVYGGSGSPVADVQDAFSTTDFTDMVPLPGFGEVPLNVARICMWTYMCAPPQLGPNIHPNATGYEQIAAAFEAAASGG